VCFGLLNSSLFYAKRKVVKRRDEEKQRKEKNAHGRKKAGRLTFVGGVGGVGGVLLRALISLEFSRKKRRAE
jgi:hypothetical protein